MSIEGDCKGYMGFTKSTLIKDMFDRGEVGGKKFVVEKNYEIRLCSLERNDREGVDGCIAICLSGDYGCLRKRYACKRCLPFDYDDVDYRGYKTVYYKDGSMVAIEYSEDDGI